MCPGLQRWHSGQTVTNVGHTRTQLLSLGLRNQENQNWNTPVPQDRILWGFIVSTEQPNWVTQSSSDLQYSTLSYKAALLKYADYSWNDSSIRKILLTILIINYSYFSSKNSKHSLVAVSLLFSVLCHHKLNILDFGLFGSLCWRSEDVTLRKLWCISVFSYVL